MGVQSDMEMLSIQAVEAYAKSENLRGDDVYELFCRHQVFEKILLQHEYLHQVAFDEFMEYIYSILSEESSELILFHGSISDFNKVNLSKSHNRRDFGKGFYTTVLEKQAKEWAYRLSLRRKTKRYYVYKFIFNENDTLKIKRFVSLNEEWLQFIKDNREEGGLQHDYDIVIGPVADDNTMETIQLYTAGILNAYEAVNRLRYNKVNNQISFHTERALEYLRYVGRVVYA